MANGASKVVCQFRGYLLKLFALKRFTLLDATWTNEVSIEADELLARLFQHELDHLDGVLLLDHLERDDRKQHFASGAISKVHGTKIPQLELTLHCREHRSAYTARTSAFPGLFR